MSDYNGWKNYETWNVALWINNDEGLYSLASECTCYDDLADQLRECSITETPDRVSYSDSGLDRRALDRTLKELRE
jgi:hypothetical protein